MFLTDAAERTRLSYASRLSLKHRSERGQFLTPVAVARWMAGQFNNLAGQIQLLDPGAGGGSLTAAVVERILINPEQVKRCQITVYEIEPVFWPELDRLLIDCCTALNQQGIEADYRLRRENFIPSAGSLSRLQLSETFTHAILNPPYRKIHSQSIERQSLTQIGVETGNLYSAFVWLTMRQLVESGELVAITPRSFCNGTYFRSFRRAFLSEMQLQKIHLFESRSATFSEDAVLQENLIFHALKSQAEPVAVEITRNAEVAIDQISEARLAAYEDVVAPDDAEQFIHIVTNPLQNWLRVQMHQMPTHLADLGLEVSTGPVVDFRLKAALSQNLGAGNVPLIYPEAVKAGTLEIPPQNPRKAIAIAHNLDTEKWLIEPGWYVLVKRFSAKEERRRVVAGVCPPVAAVKLGIENHLNYYHAQGRGMDADLARGLAAFLNSTLFDSYFRQFSGHTQVNATDLRRVKYPSQSNLIKLGMRVGDRNLNQIELDQLVHETLEIMHEAVYAVRSGQRIKQAVEILKGMAAPKEYQNERSALFLLALAGVRPDLDWSDATATNYRISEMISWIRKYYGASYLFSTQAAIGQQAMHQFVKMRLVAELEPFERSRNDSKIYQLQPSTVTRLQSYHSERWRAVIDTYNVLS